MTTEILYREGFYPKDHRVENLDGKGHVGRVMILCIYRTIVRQARGLVRVNFVRVLGVGISSRRV